MLFTSVFIVIHCSEFFYGLRVVQNFGVIFEKNVFKQAVNMLFSLKYLNAVFVCLYYYVFRLVRADSGIFVE